MPRAVFVCWPERGEVFEIIGKIVGPLLTIAAQIVGDALLAKWLGALKLWFRNSATERFQRMVDEEYEYLKLNWEKLRKERQENH